MKHSIEILLFDSSYTRESTGENIPSACFAECLKRWPQFAPPPGKRGLRVNAPAPSVLLDEVCSYLESIGKSIQWPRFPGRRCHPHAIQMRGIRELEAADLDAAPILWGAPDPMICRHDDVAPNGFITIKGSSLTQRDVGRADEAFCCSDRMRQLMEAEQFAGLSFRPVQITGKCKITTPIWQLTSNIVLPPVVTGAVNAEGQSHDPKVGDGCCVNDLFVFQVLLYPPNLLSLVPPFDVACTTERWWHKSYWRRQPTLVFSQRFRQFCLKHKLPMLWWWAQIGGEYPNPYPDLNPVYAPGHTPPPPSQPLLLR